MNNSSLRILKIGIAIIFMMAMNSCFVFKSKKDKPVTVKEPNVEKPALESAKDYLKAAITYTTFEGKADADYNDGNTSQSVMLHIKSENKSQTQVSVRAGMFGITTEVLDALAEPNSIKAKSKLQGVYYSYTFAEAAKLLNAPINFEALQQLFVGNPLFMDGEILSFKAESNKAVIKMKKDGFVQTLIYNQTNHQLESLYLKNEEKQFDCIVVFDDYRKLDNGNINFAFQRTIQLTLEGKTINLDLAFQSAVFQKPVNIQFSIPKNYRLAN